MHLILLCLLGAIWGTSFLFIKIIVQEIPPLTLVAGRAGFSAFILWVYIIFSRTKLPKNHRIWQSFALVGIFNGALPYSLISWGEQYIPSGWAALLQATTPIFTILAAHFLTNDDRITLKKATGILVGFVGVGFLLIPELREGNVEPTWGMLAIVGSSLSYAFASIYARKCLKTISPIVNSAGQLTFAFIYTIPLSIIIDKPLTLSPTPRVIISWLALALLGTVIAYNIYYLLLRYTNATFTVSVTYIVPIFGLILGSLVLKESLNPVIIVSLICILTGVLLVRGRDTVRLAQKSPTLTSKVVK